MAPWGKEWLGSLEVQVGAVAQCEGAFVDRLFSRWPRKAVQKVLMLPSCPHSLCLFLLWEVLIILVFIILSPCCWEVAGEA